MTLRRVWLSLTISLPYFLVVFSFTGTAGWSDAAKSWMYGVVALLGLVDLGLIAVLGRRPLPNKDEAKLLVAYRASFFISVGLAGGPALMGMAITLISGSLLPQAAGLGFSLVGLWRIAPTRGHIDRIQERLRASGSSLSLGRALTTMPPPVR